MVKHVLIKGEGISALTAAYILSESGINTSICQEDFSQRPILMLTKNTHWLLSNVWQLGKELQISTYPVFSKRVISVDGSYDQFPYSAYTVSQGHLQQTLKRHLKSKFPTINWLAPDTNIETNLYDWVISSTPGEKIYYKDFGTRRITSFLFNYRIIDTPNNYCQMFRTNDSWFFLFPINSKKGCLQVMHLPSKDLNYENVLKTVEDITSQILLPNEDNFKITFPAYPRLRNKLFEKNEIIIGQALARYDPISGDGAGNALRSAMWAAKIIIRALQKENVNELLRYYEVAISKHFHEHINTCNEYYKDYVSDSWRREFFSIEVCC